MRHIYHLWHYGLLSKKLHHKPTITSFMFGFLYLMVNGLSMKSKLALN